MLEQLQNEAPDILSLLGQLLDMCERAGGVAVDDEIAEPEERLLVHGPQQLEHGLDGDLAAGRGGELVERRHRVAEAAPAARPTSGERGIGDVEPPRPRHA